MKRKAPMNAFSAADAAAAAPEPAPEPAPPEVLIERKVTEIEKQTQDRIGLKKKQREKVASLPADRWTTVEGKPVLAKIFLDHPCVKAAPKEAREAGLAWLKAVRFLMTSDGK